MVYVGIFLILVYLTGSTAWIFFKSKGDFGKYEIYFNETFSGRQPCQNVKFAG
jgi:hypothetical protein